MGAFGLGALFDGDEGVGFGGRVNGGTAGADAEFDTIFLGRMATLRMSPCRRRRR
jgi:hypothetical protein